jgi:carbon-monoxide dehydrogenase small subunit
MKTAISLHVNGVARSDEVEPRMLLVHYLRDVLGLTAHTWVAKRRSAELVR